MPFPTEKEVYMKTLRTMAVAAAVLFVGNGLALHMAQAQQRWLEALDLSLGEGKTGLARQGH
jgi:hypothetical protein